VGARSSIRRPHGGESDPEARRDGRGLSPFRGEGDAVAEFDAIVEHLPIDDSGGLSS